MFNALFRDHPAEVGESYGEHLAAAASFGARMVAGGLACMVHAVIPGLFLTAGSGTVRQLHETMVAKRGAKRRANIERQSIEWVI